MDIAEDEVFGKNSWIYCRQHMRPHLTGWCGVDVRDKVGLGIFGIDKAKEAYHKCIDFRFPLINSSRTIASNSK